MIVGNLYTTWSNDDINDYWNNHQITDCSFIESINDVSNITYSKQYHTPNLKQYHAPNSKQYQPPNLKQYQPPNSTSYLEHNINTKNSINIKNSIKKLNNNNYINKPIQYYGNYSRNKNIKR